MNVKYQEKTTRLWVRYLSVVLGLFVSFAVFAFFASRSYSSMAKSDANYAAMTTTEVDAEILNNILDEGVHRLDVMHRMVEYIWNEKRESAEIESLFVAETKRYSLERDSSFKSVYGFINGRFVDGAGWIPDSSYDPQKRPWYRKAVHSQNGEIQLSLFTDSKDGSKVVAVSRLLPDKRSVVALNISISPIAKIFKKRWNSNTRWIVFGSSGEVVAHPDYSQIGENYLSNKYWGSEYEELARKVTHASDEKVRAIHFGKNRVAHVASIQDHWFLVKMYDDTQIMANVRMAAVRNIMIAAFMILLTTLMFSIGFFKRRRIANVNRVRKMIRNKMGHEMHATINGILGMNAVVMKSIHNESVRNFSENIQSAVLSFDSLVKDVRDISDNDGSVHIELGEYSPFEVLSNCYRTLLSKCAMKNLQVAFECDPSIPSGLWGDSFHLRQIINNLLSDAVKRTDSGNITVSVSSDLLPRSPMGIEDYVVLKLFIRDTGSGVAMDVDSQSMDWDSASAELCLAKLMLDACGGEFVIKSRYGEGTTFMVSLRQQVLNKEPVGNFDTWFNSQVSMENQNLETLFAPSARVLVVDDIDMNLQVVCGLLKDTKVQIDTATNANQCLELVGYRHYDLIFLDYSLPGMNGVETFERMKKISNSPNKNTPVIMVTAESVEFEKSFLKIGFADYMMKPYMEKSLLRMLAWYLPKELVLTQEDLLEFPQREMPAPTKPAVEETAPEEDEIEFHTILTPEEKLRVFNGVLNVDMGLAYFSRDVRCYYEILQEFVREDKRHGFDKTFQMKDWNNYQILIHSVCGVAQAVGAEALVAKAQEIEKACRDYKFDLVGELHSDFMAVYVNTMDSIKKGIADYEN